MRSSIQPAHFRLTSHSISSSGQWGSSAGFNGVHGCSLSPAPDLPLVWNTPFDTPRSSSEVISVQERIHFLQCSIMMSVWGYCQINQQRGGIHRATLVSLQTQTATESRFMEAGDCSSEPYIPHKVELVLPPSTHHSPSQ